MYFVLRCEKGKTLQCETFFFIKEVYSDTLTELLKDLTHPVLKENSKILHLHVKC